MPIRGKPFLSTSWLQGLMPSGQKNYKGKDHKFTKVSHSTLTHTLLPSMVMRIAHCFERLWENKIL